MGWIPSGARTSAAGKTTQPSTWSRPKPVQCASPGSTETTRVPPYRPPSLWNHPQGMPFTPLTKVQSGPISGRILTTTGVGGMRLEGQDHIGLRPKKSGIIRGGDVGGVDLIFPNQGQTLRLYRRQMRAARERRHIGPRHCQFCTQLAADSARTADAGFHTMRASGGDIQEQMIT